MQTANISEQALRCAKCFADPSRFKELRENEPLVFLHYTSICCDYLGTLQNSTLDFYNHCISTRVIAERERLTRMSSEIIAEMFRKLVEEFYKFCYRAMTISRNCAQETLENLHAIANKPIAELAERNKFTEHFFAVTKNIAFMSGDAEIVLPNSIVSAAV